MLFVVYVAIFARPLLEQVADPVKGLADLIYYPSLNQHKGPEVFKLLVRCTNMNLHMLAAKCYLLDSMLYIKFCS